jgi:hypothetical protein
MPEFSCVQKFLSASGSKRIGVDIFAKAGLMSFIEKIEDFRNKNE